MWQTSGVRCGWQAQGQMGLVLIDCGGDDARDSASPEQNGVTVQVGAGCWQQKCPTDGADRCDRAATDHLKVNHRSWSRRPGLGVSWDEALRLCALSRERLLVEESLSED